MTDGGRGGDTEAATLWIAGVVFTLFALEALALLLTLIWLP